MVVTELFAKMGLDVDEAAFGKVESFLSSTTMKLGLIVGAAAGLGAIFVGFAKHIATAGEDADRTAQRVGVTTDAVQELQFAAEESGASAEGMSSALFRMSRAAYEAKQGSSEAGQAFRGLLTLRDLKTLKPDEMFMKLAGGLSQMKDIGQRNNAVMRIFGREMGSQLVPMLNKGAEGLQELRDRAHEFGNVLSADTIKDAKEFQEASRELEARFKGIGYAIGSFALKQLVLFNRWMGRTLKTLQDWRKAHAEQILQGIKFAFILLTAATVAWGLINAGTIATALSWYAALGVAAVVNAVKAAAAWIVAAAPFFVVVAAIAVLLVWLEDLYQFLTGGDSVIGDFVATLKDSFANGIVGFLKDFGAWLLHFLPDTFVAAAKDAGEKAWAYLVEAWTKIKNLISHPMDAVLNGVSSFTGGAFGGGAASPAASAAASPGTVGAGHQVLVNAPAHIEVNTHPGMSGDEIVGSIERKISEHHDKVVREAYAASP